MSNIYEKLSKVREAVSKEEFNSFPDCIKLINRKLKNYKLLPLYCFYNDIATLSIVDMDEISMVLKFQIPVGLVSIKNVKEYLYKMAFDIELPSKYITVKEYLNLVEKMKTLGVSEQEILDRYHIKNMADMTEEIYEKCLTVLTKMSAK